MSSNHHRGRGTAKDAQALLAVFTIQPPADFATRILARVQAREAALLAQSTPPMSPPPSRRLFPRGGRAVRQAWQSFLGPRAAVASSLLMAMAILFWFAFTKIPAACIPGATTHIGPSAMVSVAADGASLRPAASLQPEVPPETPQQQGLKESAQMVLRTEVLAASPPATSSHLEAPSQAAVQSAPSSSPAEQPRGPRHKSKRTARALRPHKA